MVRLIQQSDTDAVQRMMRDLWPDEKPPYEMDGQILVWDDAGRIGGFIQIGIRPYVDGADIAPCPHIEAWFVDPDLRQQGIGTALMEAAQVWAKAQGYTQLTSDVLLENIISLEAHQKIGFEPTEQIQYFKKDLTE